MAKKPKPYPSFYEVVTAAVADMVEHGYDSPERVDKWLEAIRAAALRDTVSEATLMQELSRYLKGIYKKQVINEGLLTQNKGVPRFTLKRVAPKLRDELDKRILASASLIKMNKEARLQETLQRFAGWSTSIPAGGTDVAKKKDIKLNIGKALKSLPFDERRVIVDQGHKFNASLNDILATDGGAIAAVWHSNWKQRNYNYREDHKERDQEIYIVPGNWASQKGLIRQGLPSTEDITKPGEEVFCFPGDLEVPFANLVEKAYRRFYSGDLVTLTFASGRTLCATPNHPILTLAGWRAAGTFNIGDYAIEVADQDIKAIKENQNDGSVLSIAEIFGALQKDGIVESRNLSSTDFHGDGSNGDVEFVNSTRGLRVGWQASRPKRREHFDFAFTDPAITRFRTFSHAPSIAIAATGFVRNARHSLARFWRGLGIAQHARTMMVPQVNPGGFKAFHDGCSTNANSFRNGKKAFAGFVSGHNFKWIKQKSRFFQDFFKNAKFMKSFIDGTLAHPKHVSDFLNAAPFGTQLAKVVRVDREFRSTHVYNLQTDKGWYVTNQVITSNCRCAYEYLYSLEDLPSSMLTKKGLEAIKHAKQAYDGQA